MKALRCSVPSAFVPPEPLQTQGQGKALCSSSRSEGRAHGPEHEKPGHPNSHKKAYCLFSSFSLNLENSPNSQPFPASPLGLLQLQHDLRRKREVSEVVPGRKWARQTAPSSGHPILISLPSQQHPHSELNVVEFSRLLA